MAFEVGGSKSRVRPGMNVTPLVDVVLVLLIIFMVITPLLTKQFSLRVPPKDDGDAPPPTDGPPPIVLSVGPDGRAMINRETVDDAAIAQRVGRVLAARGDRVLFFDAADDVSYGRAMEILDRAREGGAATIAVLPEPLP